VELDPGQLEMALLNLVRNASDAMPKGGELVVSTELDGAVKLRVRDTGTGMAAHIIKRATEPFFTTKPKGAGTGLGLSMVNGFAAQSGGTMEIDSVSGEGTTITLAFPMRS
jgi:signal transduction histidine kinase